MLDTLTIILTTAAVVFVVIRAIQLDRRTPWFRPRVKVTRAPVVTELPEWDE